MKGIKFAYILKLAGTLFLITAIVALALAGVNSITAPRIAAITAEKTQKAVAEVLPGGGELLPAGSPQAPMTIRAARSLRSMPPIRAML